MKTLMELPLDYNEDLQLLLTWIQMLMQIIDFKIQT